MKTITDVDTSMTTEFTGLPTGWTSPNSTPLNLITTDQVDALGRVTEETDPLGNVTYTVYIDTNHEVRTYPGWNPSTHTTTGPIEVTREYRPAPGAPTGQQAVYDETLTSDAAPTYNATTNAPTGLETIDASNIVSLTREITNDAGQVIETDQYFSLYVPLTGFTYATATARLGSASNDSSTGNYYATLDSYDQLGRLDRVESPTGTITSTVYDGLGRVVSTWVGTNDTGATHSNPAGSGSPNNMIEVSAEQYDNGGVGDGNLTRMTVFPDSSTADARVTEYAYDWRDRLVATKSGVQSSEDSSTGRPIIINTLDNLGEVTAVSEYDGDGVTLSTTAPSASLLRAYVATAYDSQGRPYQVQQYSVDPSTGDPSSSAPTTSYWYDHRGDQIAEADPGGQVTKDQYDGAGRLVSESITDGASGTSWSAAGSLTGDHVLTQTLTAYDADGNPILVTTKDRFNTDTSSDTGALGNVTTGPEARVSYVASYYDKADRLIETADFGTNGGAAFTLPTTAPTGSDTVLVTSDTYNSAGEVGLITDPKGIVTQTSYDLLGQATQTIDAYDSTINGGQPTDSNNQTTDYTYDGLGDTLTVTAVMPSGTPSQTTQYIYGVTTGGDNAISSNDLLATVEKPDPTTGSASTSPSNQTSYSYDALGEATTETDPTGTTHTYSYDVLGRQTSDAVTSLGLDVDGSVLRITTTYDSAGNPYRFTSYDAASGGNIVNQVEDLYNGLDQLTVQYQSNEGAVVPGTTPEVQYSYSEMAGGQNNSRQTSTTYPNSRVVDDVYNAGVDSTISRVSALTDDSTGTVLESYAYLGLDTIVERDHPETGVNLSYIEQPGETNVNTDGGDQYTGLDRFGRVIDQNWVATATGTSTDRFQYAYDRAGNRLYQADLVDAALSELYHANSTEAGDDSTAYDALGRLTGFAQGVLSASGNNGTTLDTVASPSQTQSWQLDALGNATGVTTNGTPQTQTSNAQNQLTGVGTATLDYDASGNLTTDETGKKLVYDAWNRLVEVQDSSGQTLETDTYDALGRRITEDSAGQTSPAVLSDAGFESPSVGTGGYDDFEYDPSGTAWSYSGGGRRCRQRQRVHQRHSRRPRGNPGRLPPGNQLVHPGRRRARRRHLRDHVRCTRRSEGQFRALAAECPGPGRWRGRRCLHSRGHKLRDVHDRCLHRRRRIAHDCFPGLGHPVNDTAFIDAVQLTQVMTSAVRLSDAGFEAPIAGHGLGEARVWPVGHRLVLLRRWRRRRQRQRVHEPCQSRSTPTGPRLASSRPPVRSARSSPG